MCMFLLLQSNKWTLFYIYYFLQPLIFVYNNNITLLTAKLYNFRSLRVRDRFTNTFTRSLINYSYIQFTIILDSGGGCGWCLLISQSLSSLSFIYFYFFKRRIFPYWAGAWVDIFLEGPKGPKLDFNTQFTY